MRRKTKRDLILYINDISSSCEKILKYTKDYNFPEFKKDHKTIDAVIRNLEIIGEAAKTLPTKFKKNHKDIPWKQIVGMRNKVSHEYFGIDEEILWQTIQEDIPVLKKGISKVKIASKKQTLF